MTYTEQELFWQSNFGSEYTQRNKYNDPQVLDEVYVNTFGVSRSEMNAACLGDKDIISMLECGSNIGNQLAVLQKQGYKNLYGFDIQKDAVELSKQSLQDINIIWGSIFDNPFKDDFFDLVYTSGVLIHIHPDDVIRAMKEIHRTSRRYIWGFEYYSETCEEINYRGNNDRLWKNDFAGLYLETFDDLKLVYRKQYPYVEGDNVDEMFLLEKVSA